MSLFLGMTSQEDLEKGRLACLGWMLDAQDHTINEIMTSSKGFGLEYTASSDAYSQIYSQDDQFVNNLRNAQLQKNSELPDYYLSSEWVKKKAEKRGL